MRTYRYRVRPAAWEWRQSSGSALRTGSKSRRISFVELLLPDVSFVMYLLKSFRWIYGKDGRQI